jgi:16S rRNA (uracil1498-N3)-methyltransferase
VTRVFLDDSQIRGDRATITGPDAHHLLHVLRLTVGDRFVAVDRQARERSAEVLEVGERGLVARLGPPRPVEAEPPVALTLYHGLPRVRRFELVLQMGTQLGVAAFVPVLCARSVVRMTAERAAQRADRWRRIVREAARQCGRTHIPEVAEPLAWPDALSRFTQAGEPGLMPEASLAASDAPSLGDLLGELLESASELTALSLFIGPEGGFDLTEQSQAHAAGVRLVTLGPRILRSETAAVVAVAVCLHELGGLA